MFLKTKTYKSTMNYSEQINKLKAEIETADAIVIGAGAGLSTAAGYSYSGERFDKYFADFRDKYGIKDMYSGGFYPFPNMETFWAWWARHIYINRYDQPQNAVYTNLLNLVKNKNYFVITTNVDHQFQLAGFEKKRLFYMQGDYGLWQCRKGCKQITVDNEKQVREMLIATGFIQENNGKYEIRDCSNWKMEIPTALIPLCSDCDEPMTMNLRCDDSFVQDDGWYAAKNRYDNFIKQHEKLHILYLELGVGANTPVWIKYPFWQQTLKNPQAIYACVNYREAYVPAAINTQSICIDADIADILARLNDDC